MAAKSEPVRPVTALERALARSWLVLSMLGSIGLVLAVAVWSAAREREASLAEFSSRQALLATAVGADFEQRLTERGLTTSDRADDVSDDVLLGLLSGARRLESPPDLVVLVARPRGAGFMATDRRVIPSNLLRSALDREQASVVIPRDDAALLGLPRRTAIAGLARVPVRGGGAWGLVLASSAQRLRDRQILEERRLAATVAVVTLVVAAFGVIERRRQRTQLELERRVAVSSLESEHEAALAKADKMASLAALSTGIAHELGTPLGVIVGRVEQVMDRVDDERTRASLQVVLEQVDRIRRIARGCLALARGDAPELVRTSPRSIAERAVDLVRHRFSGAGVVLECAVVADLPAIACEPALFEQAVVNLLLNACEATPRGSTVRLSVRADERAVKFIVDDDGAGIPDDVMRRATEPFFSTRVGEGGSGLGLTIAREIVGHHGGVLTVERRAAGAGTRATIAVGA